MSLLRIAISSRALFDLSDSHSIFQEQGLKAYSDYQVQNEDQPLKPGDAFHFVEKLLNLNQYFGAEHVEVILLSRNSADTGLRVFNSINHYGLNITRAAFSGGESPYRYAQAFGAQLFLSTEADDVRRALNSGVAAATLMAGGTANTDNVSSGGSDTLRFAFDGDAVLFSDEAERVYKKQGLDAFTESEVASAKTPLSGGPFKAFLKALNQLQKLCAESDGSDSPIRTALVTARSAPAHERVIRTLRAWDIRLDESLFLGGMEKGEFLKAYGADVFFDDQRSHCDSAREHVATGHVPNGIANQ